ncbi:MAG: MATE family efflux transporter [Christensenellales bacterium]
MKINTFCISILFTTSNALSIFVSQNIGAGKPDRVITGTRAATIMVAVTCAVLMALCLPLSGFLISLFAEAGEGSDAVIAVGRQMLVSIVPFYAVLSVKSVTDSVLKGASKMLGFILGTSVDLCCACPARICLRGCSIRRPVSGGVGLGWLIGTAISLAFYLVYRSRLVRSLRASSPDPELVDEITGD